MTKELLPSTSVSKLSLLPETITISPSYYSIWNAFKTEIYLVILWVILNKTLYELSDLLAVMFLDSGITESTILTSKKYAYPINHKLKTHFACFEKCKGLVKLEEII